MWAGYRGIVLVGCVSRVSMGEWYFVGDYVVGVSVGIGFCREGVESVFCGIFWEGRGVESVSVVGVWCVGGEVL